MTFASFQAGKLYVRDTPCIVEVGSKKDPLHALPHSIGCQLFRMEGFSKDLKALVTGRFTTYQKTKPKRQQKRNHYASFPLYRPGGVRGAIESKIVILDT